MGVGELVFEGIKDIIVDDLHLIELVPCFHEAGLLVVTYLIVLVCLCCKQEKTYTL